MPHDSNEVYQGTVERMEPEIHHMDASACLPSIAISLKRIADAIEKQGLIISIPESLHNDLTTIAWEAGRSFKAGTETGRG